MKSILIATKAALQTGITYVRDTDVFITPATDFLPNTCKLPAIGLKDGTIEYNYNNIDIQNKLRIEFCLFHEIRKDESSIIGDDSTNRTGILDFANDIIDLLNNNMLSLPLLYKARCISESQSVLFQSSKNLVLRKILTFEYERLI